MADRGYARAMRRKTQWAGMGNNAGAATLPTFSSVGDGTASIISSGAIVSGSAGIVDEEFTITRMIGQIAATIEVTTNAIEGSLAVGCAVARQEAITAGVASLPSPEDDPDFEWLFYGVYGMHNDETSGAVDTALKTLRVDFDVRGQRIVRNGSSIVWIAEGQGSAMAALVGGRYLVKLT